MRWAIKLGPRTGPLNLALKLGPGMGFKAGPLIWALELGRRIKLWNLGYVWALELCPRAWPKSLALELGPRAEP